MKAQLLLIVFVASTYAIDKYKFCMPSSNDNCQNIEKGDSQIECIRVSDNTECAIRLAEGKADFGLFSADALLLAYQFYPDEIVPIFGLRHRDKLLQKYEFQSVAVVSSDISIAINSGFESLKNAGLCHPGFSKAQWWNDYILKYFEKNTYEADCQTNITAIENELKNIKSFYGKACRPGDWASDVNFSAALKKKYPELCALCDNTTACKYTNDEKHGHIGALDCLTSGRGKVAYVALEYVHQYFKENQKSQYRFLCPDGSLHNLTSNNPCSWIKQPWGAIVARKKVADQLTNLLTLWLSGSATYAVESWSESLKRFIEENNGVITNITRPTSLVSYLAEGRKEVILSDVKTCGNVIRWCTISILERAKCEWIAKEAIALGIEPKISCWQTNSTFECFRDIADNKADIITIDSNYGYIARKVYNLTSILYAETDKQIMKDSMIMAVLRKPEDGNYPINNFQQLKGHRACFPEYGGISWLSFVKIARMNRIISPVSCNYPSLLSNLFSGACMPGIKNNNYEKSITSAIATKLCSVCPKTNDTHCTADNDNPYYGDKGALTCLKNGDGDIAFVEIGNIKEEKNNLNQYHILCKNGSLASTTGLNLDKPELCALSVTINSEVVGRKEYTEIDSLNAIMSLLKLQDWLGYRVYTLRVLHIYGKFIGVNDLLFKSSTIGLESTTSKIESVLAYKELFNHVDECSSAGLLMFSNVTLIALIVISIYSMI
ncbi:transferrin-like [Vespa crabro]|uniref:transferrin-like n=1 Tax=Vespa crabro TaxID=7445 RepID=UPI001F004A03|nr:transferrin-like [Vespa crabro]